MFCTTSALGVSNDVPASANLSMTLMITSTSAAEGAHGDATPATYSSDPACWDKIDEQLGHTRLKWGLKLVGTKMQMWLPRKDNINTKRGTFPKLCLKGNWQIAQLCQDKGCFTPLTKALYFASQITWWQWSSVCANGRLQWLEKCNRTPGWTRRIREPQKSNGCLCDALCWC